MISEHKQTNAENILKELIQKSWDDVDFKKQLIENPKKTISIMIGDNNLSIQDGKKLIVEDQMDDSIIYLNIPAMPNYDEVELSEEDLEKISGGVAQSGWRCTIVGALLSALLSGGGSDGDDSSNSNVQIGSNNSNTQS